MRLPGQVGTIRRRVAQNSDEADMLKFPRTIRLDPSDTFVFERAAEPGRRAMVARLAGQLLEKFGAPSIEAARGAAEEEIAFAASLCDHPAQTLLAVQRSVEDGEIRERFRTLKPREASGDADRLHAHARAFTYHEVEDGAEPDEEVDLVGLMGAGRTSGNST